MSAAVDTVDPRTGTTTSTGLREHDAAEVAAICATAAATTELDAAGRGFRGRLLTAMADALEHRREEVVATADRETALGPARLNGELTRTAYQLRLFADVIAEGSYLEATVDHAGDTPMGPRPDLRRILVPTGPVAVFGASNFPLAFSVPGGDTAAALAAGCAVVVKAHGSHPLTSALCGEILAGAAAGAGAPAGTVTVVFGRAAAEALVTDPHITSVSFTGGHTGASALKRLIGQRPDPIPFYGELGSVNPLLVTAAAAAERPAEIGAGLVGSVTLGGGQFCTKPGLVLVPAGADGDAVVDAVRATLAEVAPPVLLNGGIAGSYAKAVAGLSGRTTIDGTDPDGRGFAVRPTVVVTDRFDEDLLDEVFGPLAVIVRYEPDGLATLLRRLPGSLVASVHGGSGADPERDAAAPLLRERTGRVLFDGYPTGVAVSWAQHHGGPWPSTDTIHTSVGATSIRRFLRPVAWQSAPEHLLPAELRDGPVAVPRRVDGALVLPS
ncbi:MULTISPECIES: aldehyde dehydrogenase family protein [unclassified Pseudonocardia]|uniref:aldehyde dehydrogenase family protein n=1 Tax=unclassified Pseudonocardia TaxID=2619320 RepID=UPI0001FFED5B|nr:aldehyde dehydrogenase family protein [Pseudonocardia sp. Ae707_Ps1]OLM17418.1 Ketoglutarate semialdehyde dehydrogenase [Pseudonocardia sp. Ae707_Ps1]